MPTRIQIRRDTTDRWTSVNPVLGIGEPGYDITAHVLKVGDGATRWLDLPGYIIVDAATNLLPASVMAALDSYNQARYADAASFYSWSYARNAAGAGPGGVSIDPTAAANVARNTTAKASEGYVAIGRDALGAATRARSCIAIGPLALGLGNPGFSNLGIGTFALSNVQGISELAADLPGSRNIGIGTLAGYFLTNGYYNTFVGRDSGQTNTTGTRNTGLGYGAFSRGVAPIGLDGTITNYYPTTGTDNTAVGAQAGQLLAGSSNVLMGSQAAIALRASDGNVIIGAGAASLLGGTSSENSKALTSPGITGTYTQSGTTITVTATAHGAVAGNKVGLSFTSGAINTTTGEMQWLTVASVPNANTLTVTSPVSQTTSGNVTVVLVETAATSAVVGSNTVLGWNAMGQAATSAGNQTIIGESAGLKSTGGNNTLIGTRAGYNLTNGSSNVFLGQNAGRTLVSGADNTGTANSVALGFATQVSGDNQVQLGNSSTTTYVYGTVQNRSDERDKADIRDTELGLDFVNALRPVDYRWDMREDYVEHDDEGAVVAVHERDGSKKRERFHHGLVAQEVAEVLEQQGVDFGGLQDHARDGGADVLSIGYDELIGPLIRAVQQLTARVAELEKQ